MKETKRLYNVFEFFKYCALALIPILGIYTGFQIISLGFAILLVLMILEIMINRGRFEINKELLIIMAIMTGLNIIIGVINMSIGNIKVTMNITYLVDSFSMLVVTVICGYFVKSSVVDKDRFFKYLCVVGVLSTVFIFIQYILYLFGIIIHGFIPGLTVDKAVGVSYTGDSILNGRPTSFFAEPAHYATFIMPIYALALFRRKFFLSALFLAGLFVSTSSTGLLGALVVTGIFIASEKKIPIIIKWIFAIIGVMLLIQFLPTINKSGIFEKMKLFNLTSNTRVFGMLEYFRYFGPVEAIFGVGLNQIANYMTMFTTEDVSNYANALFFSFFCFGLLGGTFWSAYVFRLHRLSRNKILFIVFLIIYLSDEILFNRNLVYLLLLMYVFSDKDEAMGRLPETSMINVSVEESADDEDSSDQNSLSL